jgi:alkanesulfonate monooxygenase
MWSLIPGEFKVAAMASGSIVREPRRHDGAGQRRLAELAARGEVLDDNLYTVPQTVGGNGAASTWLVGSAEDAARSLDRYRDLGVSHFVLSDTPYLPQIERQGRRLLPLLREVRTVNGASRFS